MTNAAAARTRTASVAFVALNDAMTRVMALEAQITNDIDLDLMHQLVEQIDYQMDIAVGAWADLVVADVIGDLADMCAIAQQSPLAVRGDPS